MNYSRYRYSLPEIVKECSIYILVCAAVSYVFYHSLIVFCVAIPGFPVYISFRRKAYISKRQRKLKKEFAEMLFSICAALRSGYSIENAFCEATKDMFLFFGEKSLMARELQNIQAGLSVNRTLEELMNDFARRSKVDEIMLFTKVLDMARHNGGNLPEVFEDIAFRIRETICTDNEIEVIISEKKLELRIMEIVPILIPMYLEFTSGGYFETLYKGVEGRIVATACLFVYVLSVYAGEKIMRIDV